MLAHDPTAVKIATDRTRPHALSYFCALSAVFRGYYFFFPGPPDGSFFTYPAASTFEVFAGVPE